MANIKPFITIDEINQVGDFARKYTWNMVFDTPESNYIQLNIPEKFKSWFPIINCNIELYTIDSFDIVGGLVTSSVPKGRQGRQLSLDMYDNFKYDFSKWVYDWKSQIVNINNNWVLPVVDACCKCKLVVYDSVGKHIRYGAYYVYPTESQQIELSSDGDPYQFQSEFIIAGVESELFGNTGN